MKYITISAISFKVCCQRYAGSRYIWTSCQVLEYGNQKLCCRQSHKKSSSLLSAGSDWGCNSGRGKMISFSFNVLMLKNAESDISMLSVLAAEPEVWSWWSVSYCPDSWSFCTPESSMHYFWTAWLKPVS